MLLTMISITAEYCHFYRAFRNKDAEKIDYYVSKGLKPHILSLGSKLYGIRPLELAFMGEHYDIAEQILQHGADIDRRNDYGETLLMNAVGHNNLYKIKFLLEHGANPNIFDHFGFSILVVAYNLKIYKLLLSYGADPYQCNSRFLILDDYDISDRTILNYRTEQRHIIASKLAPMKFNIEILALVEREKSRHKSA